MNFSEMMGALVRRFPRHAAEIDEWSSNYRRVVGHLPPARLEAIFSGVMDRWTRASPPKPGDFAVLGPSSDVVEAVGSLGALTAVNDKGIRKITRVGFEQAKRDARRMVDDALRNSPEPLTGDEASRLAVRLRGRAWMAAQFAMLGQSYTPVEIMADDIARVRAGIRADGQHPALLRYERDNAFSHRAAALSAAEGAIG